MLTYQGYTAEINVDVDARLLRGQVLDIKDTITFEGKDVDEAIREFQKSVDDYIAFCKELGQEPDKPFSGRLLFRTSPDIHRSIYLAAKRANKSINAWIEDTVKVIARQELNEHSPSKR